jgi:CDP-diacylglycerol--serine O-phosphatidyltransferase
MIKQIPNIFTLLNLVFGCMAIIVTLQTGLIINNEVEVGNPYLEIPEKIVWASVFIAAAAVIDFFDGFVARLLKASSEMGKQLDSLADVVSFGVAPGMIIYQFLKISMAQHESGLDVSTFWLLPAFIVPCAGAYRLARFNIDTEQSYGFKGVPIPAVGLLVASFPLIYWFSSNEMIIQTMRNKWVWYLIILLLSYLMVSTLPMLALKFKGVTLKKLIPFLLVLIVSIATAIFLGWFSVPVGFSVYVIASLVLKNQS